MTFCAFEMATIDSLMRDKVTVWWPNYIDQSAWLEHTPFAAWLMENLSPRLFVELGTHSGVSYFSFCQAASSLRDRPICFAIDTWSGDAHTGPYNNEIFLKVNKINTELYASFSSLMRCSFMEALEKFENSSVDLLHIDGFHTYEAVTGDFKSWLPKMSDQGIVLFHDITVKHRDFGVWKLWDELTKDFPHFAFLHGHGLGIIAVGDKTPEKVRFLFESENYPGQTQYLRESFQSLGARVSKSYTDRLQAGRRRTVSDTTLSVGWRPGLPRQELLLAGAKKDWKILEIGPSHRPVADKKSGWKTSTIDHASREHLIEKYKQDKFVDTSRIEEVDFIWTNEDLKNIIPSEMHGTFDILIASHVIEHFPDPISVLVAAESLLRPDTGLISLAVPDKRLCFDFFRPLSSTGKFLAAHRDARCRHSAADLFDSVAYLAALGPNIAWDWRSTDAVRPLYSLNAAYQKFCGVGETSQDEYQDCHGWTFTPASFELLILELSALGVLDWHVQSMLPQKEVEFIVHLARGKAIFDSSQALEQRRFELLRQIQRDLYQQTQYYFGEASQTLKQKTENACKEIWRKTVPPSLRRRVAQLRGKIPLES